MHLGHTRLLEGSLWSLQSPGFCLGPSGTILGQIILRLHFMPAIHMADNACAQTGLLCDDAS